MSEKLNFQEIIRTNRAKHRPITIWSVHNKSKLRQKALFESIIQKIEELVERSEETKVKSLTKEFEHFLEDKAGRYCLFFKRLVDGVRVMIECKEVEYILLTKIFNDYEGVNKMSMMVEENPLTKLRELSIKYNRMTCREDYYDIFFKAMYINEMIPRNRDIAMYAKLFRIYLTSNTYEEACLSVAEIISFCKPITEDLDEYLPGYFNMSMMKEVAAVGIDDCVYPYGNYTGMDVKYRISNMYDMYQKSLDLSD